jgi:Kef-type K+ transport system membrane component KefB
MGILIRVSRSVHVFEWDVSPLIRFGWVLLGGLSSGELTRRGLNLPRTTGYVLFGVLVGQSGLGWVPPSALHAAHLFIYPGIGIILFELGHRFPLGPGWPALVRIALSQALLVFAGLTGVLLALGFGGVAAAFGGAIGVATSSAITIATGSDVGADGPRSSRLFALVALNGMLAFCMLGVIVPFSKAPGLLHALAEAVLHLGVSLALALVLAESARWGARLLGPQPEHQHLMLLGLIILGTGVPLSLGFSPLLCLICFGIAARVRDARQDISTLRIASDARVFLVITFSLAGAALDVGLLGGLWPVALIFGGVRFGASWLALALAARRGWLEPSMVRPTAIGLMPMSSVTLVLLGDAASLQGVAGEALGQLLLASIALFQLCGPPCTQAAVKGFGEARRYVSKKVFRELWPRV